jgi:hypothetical protein
MNDNDSIPDNGQLLHQGDEAGLPQQIIVSDGETLDAPLLSISRYAPGPADQYEPISLDGQQAIDLSILMQHASNLAVSTTFAAQNTYVLTFSPEVAAGLRDGKFNLMRSADGLRATAVRKDGQIVGQGILKSATGVRAIAAVGAVWQLMALVTAQVYLSDISQRLVRLERGVGQLREILEAHENARLVQALNYLRDVQKSLANPDLTTQEFDVLIQRVEHHWDECSVVATAKRARLANSLSKPQQLQLKTWYGIEQSVTEAEKQLADYERLYAELMLATYARTAAIQVRCALGMISTTSTDRLDHLRTELLGVNQERRAFFDETVSHINKNLSATFSRSSTIVGHKQRLQKAVDQSRRRLKDLEDHVAGAVVATERAIEHQIATAREQLSLIVVLDEQGRISEAHRLLAPANAS